MKTAFMLCALATSVFAGPPVLVRITPEALAKIQQANPIAQLEKPVEGEAKVTTPAEQSIIKQSMVLHDGKNWTIVPKGAVIFIPDNLKSWIDAKPLGKILAFNDFMTLNRKCLTTTEVTFDQAAGNESLPAERAHFWAKQDKIVIAVHQNGPISVQIATESQAITKR